MHARGVCVECECACVYGSLCVRARVVSVCVCVCVCVLCVRTYVKVNGSASLHGAAPMCLPWITTPPSALAPRQLVLSVLAITQRPRSIRTARFSSAIHR